MQKELLRYVGREVYLMYMDRNHRITKRRIRIRSVDGPKLSAYCYERLAPRVFDVSRVLAVFPVHLSTVQA
ncbi:hypothetical protein ACFQ88_13865 [Paenibacillus sp. NPDC056579]|uniref:hypothetical protein n=1 Tax=unclassified Paenibacillus TaxID=185978 RepID=UPI001EF87E0F|nr:hypothetical protein [Paenibacillus sp. H1-7]ULL17518.1 hypothetical protein DVH26_25540 [Paenibacillus sp. H1-7]